MPRFMMYGIAVLLAITTLLLSGTAGRCADRGGENAAAINIKKVADGLVVNVSASQQNLDAVRFGCEPEQNRIIVDLPTDSDQTIVDELQSNPNVVRGRISAEVLDPESRRISIVPRLKLNCDGVKLVSRFQRYITYFYPAGRNLQLTSVAAQGFDFDTSHPRAQVSGSLRLIFNEPLGDLDLAGLVTTTENVLSVRLNPRDFVDQAALGNAFATGNLTVRSSAPDYDGVRTFSFQTIGEADIARVKAKLVASPTSNEARIDIILTVGLYATGKKFYERGNTARALDYMGAAKQDPAFSLVSRMSMGTIYWNEDNYTEAVRNFRELISLDRAWEFPDARYYALKSHYLLNKSLNFELSAMLKELLRRCERMKYSTCGDARELFEEVNEPPLKLIQVSKSELKSLTARLADPRLNYNEVQKNVFHYWATWCPVCLEEMPRIMQYAVAHPNVTIHIVAKHDNQKAILSTLLKSGAIRRKNIVYYIDTKDDILLRQMVPLVLANKAPVTPLPISVFLQRDTPFYLTDKLNWTEAELAPIWRLRYRE